jgi:hypothetical protein
MVEPITGFVGLDAHAESTAIGVAELGRSPARFVGTVGARFSELKKALGKLGEPSSLMIVYEAGPCRYALARPCDWRGIGVRRPAETRDDLAHVIVTSAHLQFSN